MLLKQLHEGEPTLADAKAVRDRLAELRYDLEKNARQLAILAREEAASLGLPTSGANWAWDVMNKYVKLNKAGKNNDNLERVYSQHKGVGGTYWFLKHTSRAQRAVEVAEQGHKIAANIVDQQKQLRRIENKIGATSLPRTPKALRKRGTIADIREVEARMTRNFKHLKLLQQYLKQVAERTVLSNAVPMEQWVKFDLPVVQPRYFDKALQGIEKLELNRPRYGRNDSISVEPNDKDDIEEVVKRAEGIAKKIRSDYRILNFEKAKTNITALQGADDGANDET